MFFFSAITDWWVGIPVIRKSVSPLRAALVHDTGNTQSVCFESICSMVNTLTPIDPSDDALDPSQRIAFFEVRFPAFEPTLSNFPRFFN